MSDTISLLRECDAGIKMAVESIDEVAAKVKDVELLKVLQKSKEQHEKLGNEVDEQIHMYGAQEKEPNLMARGMSWIVILQKWQQISLLMDVIWGQNLFISI